MPVRIANVDPESVAALSLLRHAAIEVRALYDEIPGPPWPTNSALGPRDIYVLAYEGEDPIACGAFRELDARTCEVHRVFVLREYRRRGVASEILSYLQEEARRMGYELMRLETGKRQLAAMEFYARFGFSKIEPFGVHVGDPTSVCYELRIGARGAGDQSGSGR